MNNEALFACGGSFSCPSGYRIVLNPHQLALNGTRSTCSVPVESMPSVERLSAGWCSTVPPRMSNPLGQPPSQLKKSPLTPIVVSCDETRRSIDDTVSRPVIVSFESSGARL